MRYLWHPLSMYTSTKITTTPHCPSLVAQDSAITNVPFAHRQVKAVSTFAAVGTSFLCLVDVSMGVGFAVYARQLGRTLRGINPPTPPPTQTCERQDLLHNIETTYLFCFALVNHAARLLARCSNSLLPSTRGFRGFRGFRDFRVFRSFGEFQ